MPHIVDAGRLLKFRGMQFAAHAKSLLAQGAPATTSATIRMATIRIFISFPVIF
jgi:hypothetical protein